MESRRIDLEREVSIRVPAFDSFVTEYSANLSTTGMFILTEKPLPPDTELSFEFRVADDWKLIRGTARVIWSRYRDEGPNRAPGMGVLFTEIDAQSRRLINWIVEKHVRGGGTPFSLDEFNEAEETPMATPEVAPREATPSPVTRVVTQPSFKAPPKVQRPKVQEPVRFRLAPLVFAGLIAAGLIGLLFWLSEKGAQSAANPELAQADRSNAAEVDSAANGATAGTASEAPEGTEAGSTGEASVGASVSADTPDPALAQEAERLVANWAEDWSNQDVAGYLSHYADAFVPSNGQSRQAWAAGRGDRLRAPEFIQIAVTALEIESLDDTRGRVLFQQAYRSNTYEDSVSKALEIVREDGRWKILSEAAAN